MLKFKSRSNILVNLHTFSVPPDFQPPLGADRERRYEQGLMRICYSCLRNVVTLFQYIEKERVWRKANGRPVGFETLDQRKPIGMFL
jgi:hypothetical protein